MPNHNAAIATARVLVAVPERITVSSITPMPDVAVERLTGLAEAYIELLRLHTDQRAWAALQAQLPSVRSPAEERELVRDLIHAITPPTTAL